MERLMLSARDDLLDIDNSRTKVALLKITSEMPSIDLVQAENNIRNYLKNESNIQSLDLSTANNHIPVASLRIKRKKLNNQMEGLKHRFTHVILMGDSEIADGNYELINLHTQEKKIINFN